MITSYKRGHKIYFSEEKNRWLYCDNDRPITDERPCARCGEMPTKEGYDHCLGYIDGATSACCGHGKEAKYVVIDEKIIK